MADKPILFSGPMVRALLAGTKTQTRRVIKPRGHASLFDGSWADSYVLDPGNKDWRDSEVRIAVGDRLYVRETWAPLDRLTHNDPGTQALADRGFYQADGGTVAGEISRWTPAIHQPRWASRLTLTVTEVRVERLKDCSSRDAIAEGIQGNEFEGWLDYSPGEKQCDFLVDPRQSYRTLWDSINGEGAWDANPWVAAYTFTVERRNIDQLPLAS